MLIQKIAIPWVTLYASIAIAILIAIVIIVNKIQKIIERE
jgi:1,4-dihydroxy-2-naphthoate octaprenyltransferase